MSGSVVKRGPHNYAAVVYCGVDPQTRKRRYRWTSGFRTDGEARAHLAMLAQHPATGAGVGPFGSSRLRLGDYLRQWLRAGQISEHERRTRESYLKCHLIPALGHVTLARLHPVTIQEFIVRQREAGMHPTTIYHTFKLLRAALNQAMRLGLIAANPCAHVTAPRPQRYEPTLWTQTETQAFLVEARQSSRYYCLYLTVIGTGLRAGEALALLWRNLDLDRGVVHVTHVLERPKGGGWVLREFPKSTHSRRPVRLPDAVLAELRVMWQRNLGLIFCQVNGKPLHGHNVVRRDFYEVAKRAGVPHIRFHDLRHLHGSALADAGVNPKEIQERLGHANPAFTLNRYIHTPVDLQRASAAVANQLLITSRVPVLANGDGHNG